MAIVIYGLKNCDSCRKALKALPGAVLVDVRAEGLPAGLLETAFAQFGDALMNTRSTTWRTLTEDQRDGDPLTLISEYPALMKRPLIAVDQTLFLSWNKTIEDEVNAIL